MTFVRLPTHPLSLPETYTAYAYSYPHKSSYAPLNPAIPLAEAWRGEPTSGLLLYVHLPFCEMRCGFCNLFTQSQPADELVWAYLEGVDRQSEVIRDVLPPLSFSQFVLGGGTPTYLTTQQFARLFEIAKRRFAVDPGQIFSSVETSPATATPDRLSLLAEAGIQRLSMGVQSFSPRETSAMGRPQSPEMVERSLERIREKRFPCLNVDLIYGAEGQTACSWLDSLHELMQYSPEEIYLYPLYIRPQTGLARTSRSTAASRLELYQLGRDFLLAQGYRQISMRAFRKSSYFAPDAGDYQCQTDGTIGLGCGARSYTSRLHYSSGFAVSQPAIRRLIREWVVQPPEEFAIARFGYELNEEERQRRFLLLSLLQCEGFDACEFAARFGFAATDRFPELSWLSEAGYAVWEGDTLRLTASGVEQSDAIGPLLYSPAVRDALARFAPA